MNKTSRARPPRFRKPTNPKEEPMDSHVGNTKLQSSSSIQQYRRIDDDVDDEGEDRIERKASSSGKREDENRHVVSPSVDNPDGFHKVVDLIKQQAQESKRGKAPAPKDSIVNESEAKDSPQAQVINSSTSNPPERTREQFKAFGIEAFPTPALRNEICHHFVSPFAWCEYGNKCRRIHPLDKVYYWRAMKEERKQRNSSQKETASRDQDAVATITTKADPEIPGDLTPAVKLPPTLLAEPSWDTTGVWQTFTDPKAWTDSSSSSGDSSQESSMFSSATVSSQSSVAGDSECSFQTVTPENRVCFDWLNGSCGRISCRFAHELPGHGGDFIALQRDQYRSQSRTFPSLDPTGPRHLGQRRRVCNDWLRGNCPRGHFCAFAHQNIGENSMHSPSEPGKLDQVTVIKPPRPKNNERCRLWLRDQCPRGAYCNYVHEDIEYADDVVTQSSHATKFEILASKAQGPPHVPRKPPEVLSITVHDHIKIKLGAGFEVQQVITGFESHWLFISNVPLKVTDIDVMRLLRPHGTVFDIRMLPPDSTTSTKTVKVQMSNAAEASRVCAALNGTKAFGTTIAARVSVTNSRSGNVILCDTSVRVIWDVPGKSVFAGYSSIEHANEAMRRTREPFGDRYLKANIHVGLPAVGKVTVRFRGVPVDADEDVICRFTNSDDIVWQRPPYKSLEYAVSGIKRLLQMDGIKLLGFEIDPPPYKNAQVLAWAHFATPSDAEYASKKLDGRKPSYTGLTRINVQHVKSISYSLNATTYRKLSKDIDNLQQTAWNQSTILSVVQNKSTAPVTVKLSSEDLQKLGRVKMEMENILTGEVIKRDGKVAWDGFFGRPTGLQFLQELERKYFGMDIERNVARRMIRLFGSLLQRRLVREAILNKLHQIESQRIRVVRLEGRLIGIFMDADLMKLQEKLGPENVVFDIPNRCLRIRGDDEAYAEAQEIVDTARHKQTQDHSSRKGATCPVCMNDAAFPIYLGCGHTWCRSCLKNYLEAAHSQKFFPLTCLGNEARCSASIPLGIAREIMPIADFEALANAAFSAHIHSHPDEFHFCPTPDCQQVYRTATVANGAPIQCPSCLTRICTKCHAEAHEGLACLDADDDDQFQEWVKTHDVKNCPGCNIPIERMEGCNHMTCTRCQTHTCWVCMATFPGGEGIYGHMRTVHGGFGLGPIE